MKTTLTIIFLLLATAAIKSQELSLQFMPGIIQYNGDLQGEFVSAKTLRFATSFGANLRFNQLAFRVNAMFGKIVGADSLETNSRTTARNLSFQSSLFEFTAGLQYEFFYDKKLTPYVFASAGILKFDPYTYNDANEKVYLQPLSTEGQGLPKSGIEKYKLTQFVVPLGAGVKYSLSDSWCIGAEFSTRILSTDYLDDVSSKYPDPVELANARGAQAVALSYRGPRPDFPAGAIRGNPDKNDTYYTASVSIIYIFNRSESKKEAPMRYRTRQARTDCPKPAH